MYMKKEKGGIGRSENQRNRIKSTGMVLSEFRHLTNDKVAWQISGAKESLFDKWCWETGYPFGGKKKS